MAAARFMPGVCAVLGSSSLACTTRTPSNFHFASGPAIARLQRRIMPPCDARGPYFRIDEVRRPLAAEEGDELLGTHRGHAAARLVRDSGRVEGADHAVE